MPEYAELREWMEFDITAMLVGVLLVVGLCTWYGFVFSVTRKKPQRTLATLKPKPYAPPDITRLQEKYLSMLSELEEKYSDKKLSNKAVHQKLSCLVRFFAYEINGHRVDTLTLADLEKSRYENLTKAVRLYYPAEFAKFQESDVATSMALAREVIQKWN